MLKFNIIVADKIIMSYVNIKILVLNALRLSDLMGLQIKLNILINYTENLTSSLSNIIKDIGLISDQIEVQDFLSILSVNHAN